jgi:hypothetical protein
MTPNPAAGTAFSLTAVSCPSTTDCTAVGQYINSADFAPVLAEQWNGSSWTMQSIPSPSAGQQLDVSGLSCAATDVCTMVGTYENSASATVMLGRAMEWGAMEHRASHRCGWCQVQRSERRVLSIRAQRFHVAR